MGRKHSIDSGFPKKRLTAAFTGLCFTALGFAAEKVFRSVLDTALSIVAGASIMLLVMGVFAFIGAWERRDNIHEKQIFALKMNIREMREDEEKRCVSCSFNHQSLLVGLSTNHVNELQKQREFYEDYIAAVLYVLDTTIVRAVKAESSVLPIVQGLLNSPLYHREKNNKELKKWKTLLNSIRENQDKPE